MVDMRAGLAKNGTGPLNGKHVKQRKRSQRPMSLTAEQTDAVDRISAAVRERRPVHFLDRGGVSLPTDALRRPHPGGGGIR
jgi:hypothetical protein